MLLTISTASGEVLPLEVGLDTDMATLKALISMDTNIPPERLLLLKDGQPLAAADSSLVRAMGLAEGDMLFALDGSGLRDMAQSLQQGAQRQQPPASRQAAPVRGGGLAGLDFSSIQIPTEPRSASAPPPRSATRRPPGGNVQDNPEYIRQELLQRPAELAMIRDRNAALANAIHDKDEFARVFNEQRNQARKHDEELRQLMVGDQLNPNVQARIAELIKQRNIDSQMEEAMEHMPEVFAQVTMLYVNCRVFGHPVKAFVDSGAQMTIMSEACARRCNVHRLIDTRWSGIAKGVGTQKIIGRVHTGQVQIENDYLQSSFSVLEDQQMDMLIGLDMLKRHQCCIDLKSNCLIIGTTGTRTPFLPENELPEYARLNNTQGGEGSENPAQGSAPSSSSGLVTDEEEAKLHHLTGQGFSRDECLKELRIAKGDMDQALAALIGKSMN